MLLCLSSRQGQQMLSSGMPKRPPMTREIVPSQNNQMAPPPTNNEIMHEEIIKYIHSAWHKVNKLKFVVFLINYLRFFCFPGIF